MGLTPTGEARPIHARQSTARGDEQVENCIHRQFAGVDAIGDAHTTIAAACKRKARVGGQRTINIFKQV